MKSNFYPLLPLLGASLLPVFANDSLERPAPFKPFPEARTYIPHQLAVPPFTPPPPPVPKITAPVRIDSSVTRRAADGTRLTLQRGEPSAEPVPPPPPPPKPAAEPGELTPEQIARLIYQRRHRFMLGATVFDHRASIVNWTHPDTGASYQALCGFDLGLLAGIGSFIHEEETYHLTLFHSHIDTTVPRRFLQRAPEVPDGAILITRGDPDDAIGTAPIIILRQLIAVEKDRLEAYRQARLEYQRAYRAWHAANPPVPRDNTIILRPNQGSRYLPKH